MDEAIEFSSWILSHCLDSVNLLGLYATYAEETRIYALQLQSFLY